MAYALYRLYGEEETLLYVGMSMNLPGRLTNHRVQKTWWASVRHITVEHFSEKRAVLDAEREAIQTEHPLWNIQHSVGPPLEPVSPYQEAIGYLFGLVPELAEPARRQELASAFDDEHQDDEYQDGTPADYSRWPVEVKALLQALTAAVDERWLNADAVRSALNILTDGDPSFAMFSAREIAVLHGDGPPTEGGLERFALVQTARRVARTAAARRSADVRGD